MLKEYKIKNLRIGDLWKELKKRELDVRGEKVELVHMLCKAMIDRVQVAAVSNNEPAPPTVFATGTRWEIITPLVENLEDPNAGTTFYYPSFPR